VRRNIALALFLAVIAIGWSTAQQPQSSTAPDFGASARYVQGGSAGGYRPTAGSGLTLDIGGGTAWCNGTIITYSAGTLTMTASATNFVYLDPGSSCAPSSNTVGFASNSIPIATVATSGSAITSISDDRTMFVASSGGGGGAGAGIQAGNCDSGGTSCTITMTNTAGYHLFVGIEGSNSGTNSVTDSNSNSYSTVNSALQSNTAGDVGIATTFEAHNIAAGANTITCSTTDGTYVMRCVAITWSDGLTTSGLDQTANGVNTSANPIFSAASSATTHANEIVFAWGALQTNGPGGPSGPGAGFTVPSGANSGNVSMMEYKIVTSTGTQQGTFPMNSPSGISSTVQLATFN
jgi:hypothetical protein